MKNIQRISILFIVIIIAGIIFLTARYWMLTSPDIVDSQTDKTHEKVYNKN